jgi:pimeloyl-ACP methyl ester carboxylesterase
VVNEPTRRAVLIGGASVLSLAALGGAGAAAGVVPVPRRIRRMMADTGPNGVIPAAPAGQVRLEKVHSTARGRQVGLWTAVPAGFGSGKGLPVCLILHGGSATTANYTSFGFANFLTSAVRHGAPPFVLAGADGGLSRWEGDGAGDDPQRMLREEIPAWCTARGFDASRLAAYGWSMGGYGSLRLAERNPDLLRMVAVLSPAVAPGDPAFVDASKLAPSRTGVWCGRSDPFFPAVQEFVRLIEPHPAVASWSKGAHQRGYWNRVTPAAFALVGQGLA